MNFFCFGNLTLSNITVFSKSDFFISKSPHVCFLYCRLFRLKVKKEIIIDKLSYWSPDMCTKNIWLKKREVGKSSNFSRNHCWMWLVVVIEEAVNASGWETARKLIESSKKQPTFLDRSKNCIIFYILHQHHLVSITWTVQMNPLENIALAWPEPFFWTVCDIVFLFPFFGHFCHGFSFCVS